jgi:outer membrane protein TolC
MGMPVNEELELTGSISDIQPEELAILEQEVNYPDRIEYSSLSTNYEVNRLNMKATQTKYLPRISAYYQVGINAGVQSGSDLWKFTDNTKWFNNEVLGIRMDIPIFDGLLKSYQIQRQRLVLSQLDQQRYMLENSIDTEIQQSKVALANNLKVLRSQEKNMELAEYVYNTAKIKYQEGIGSSLEVIDADNAFKESQTNYFNSLYDALIAKVDLEKALGLLENKYK